MDDVVNSKAERNNIEIMNKVNNLCFKGYIEKRMIFHFKYLLNIN